MDMCTGTLSTQSGFLQSEILQEVDTLCGSYVSSTCRKYVPYTPLLYICRYIHCTSEGLHSQKRPSLGNQTWFLIKFGECFNVCVIAKQLKLLVSSKVLHCTDEAQ